MSDYMRANAIYDEMSDMDFADYDDTRERTIDFIVSLLNEIGESATRSLLATM